MTNSKGFIARHPLVSIRAWSRSASICAAVSAPPSVTICSSTRRRCFDALHVLGILGALFGREVALGCDLLLLDAKPHLERRDRDRRDGNEDPDPGCRIDPHDLKPLLRLECRCRDVRIKRASSHRASWRHLLRAVAKRLDLRGGLGAAVGDDLLEHADALFKLVRSRRILGGFLGRVSASTSSFFSRNLKKRLAISMIMTVGRPMTIVASIT